MKTVRVLRNTIFAAAVLFYPVAVCGFGDFSRCETPPLNRPYEAQGSDEISTFPDSTALAIEVMDSELSVLVPNDRLDLRTRGDIYRESHSVWSRNDFFPISLPWPAADIDAVSAPGRRSHLFAKIVDGTYVRSEDGGKTWVHPQFRLRLTPREVEEQLSKPQNHLDFWIVAIDPRDPSILYAAVRVLPWMGQAWTSAKQFLKGVYVSRDGGDTWEPFTQALTSLGPAFEYSASLGISPSDPNVMYGASAEGLVISKDAGATWELAGNQNDMNSPVQFSGTFRGKHLSSVWRPGQEVKGELAGVPRQPIRIRQISVSPQDKDVLFVITDKGLYRSADGAQNWKLLF